MKVTRWTLAIIAVLVLAASGCTQPRFGSLEYSCPYGNTARNSEKRWWGEEKSTADFDIDKFMWRWRGLTQ
jgi:hypothetical protein